MIALYNYKIINNDSRNGSFMNSMTSKNTPDVHVLVIFYSRVKKNIALFFVVYTVGTSASRFNQSDLNASDNS